MDDQEYISLINAIHDVSGNIRSLAQSIDEGRTEPLEPSLYIDAYRYETLAALLVHAGCAEGQDILSEPSEALKEKVNPLLAEAGLTIEQLYEDARKGATFMLQQLWEDMKDTPEPPESPNTTYDLFHSSMKFLSLPSGSAEICELLDTTPHKFTRVDKSFALACAYESFRNNQKLVRLFAEQQKTENHQNRGLAGQFAAARDFKQRYDEGAARVFEDLKRLMRQSGLRNEEVRFYFTSRLQADGDMGHDSHSPLN